MTTRRTPTNKLSIFLLKDSHDTLQRIFNSPDDLKVVNIEEGIDLYYSNSQPKPPKWIGKFFGTKLSSKLNDELYTAHVSAVLLVRMGLDGRTKRFALAFGLGGWQLLKPGSYEERFGLKCTLNLVSPESIRSIDKNSMGLSPKQTREQISKAGDIANFGVDVEQDLVKAVTGRCNNTDHGTTITGKDSLHITSKTNISNLKDMLATYYAAYISESYKNNFGWIDQIAEIKDPTLIERLSGRLIDDMRHGQTDSIWLAVPEVIDWADIEGFIYLDGTGHAYQDLFMRDLIDNACGDANNLTIEKLKEQQIVAISSSTQHEIMRWRSYNCIYAETRIDDDLYILNNGKWYHLENDFVQKVDTDYANILQDVSSLPYYDDKDEAAYNARVSKELGLTLMDRKNIPIGGGHSKVEFCDLFDYTNKKLIHVKHYGGSSVMSHLFNQGLVSAQLMLSDIEFRQRVNSELPSGQHFAPVTAKPNPADFEVIFAVISSSRQTLNIPFFSKVSLRNAKRTLELFGIKKVTLLKIQVDTR